MVNYIIYRENGEKIRRKEMKRHCGFTVFADGKTLELEEFFDE